MAFSLKSIPISQALLPLVDKEPELARKELEK